MADNACLPSEGAWIGIYVATELCRWQHATACSCATGYMAHCHLGSSSVSSAFQSLLPSDEFLTSPHHRCTYLSYHHLSCLQDASVVDSDEADAGSEEEEEEDEEEGMSWEELEEEAKRWGAVEDSEMLLCRPNAGREQSFCAGCQLVLS